MSRRTRNLRASVAFAAVAVLLSACSDEDADASGDGGDQSSSPSAGLADISLPDGVLALPEPGADGNPVVLDAGRYQISLSDTLALEVDLAQGSTPNGEGLYLETLGGVLKVEAAGEEYGVPVDPCTDQEVEPVGPTVADLVEAIQALPIYEVSDPEPVVLDGAEGTRLEIAIPAGFDSFSCQSQQVGLPGNPETSNNMVPGYVGTWWIVDVDGQRVVLQQICDQCADGAADDLTPTVESITFTSTS